MVSFGKKKNPFHTLFSSALKGTLNVATDTQTFQLVHIQACLFRRTSLRTETVFSYYTNPPCLILLPNLNTTSLPVIKLTLLLAFQINYKVTSIIQNFYPLSSYFLQSNYLQMQLSDPGYPHGLNHSQILGVHGHSLQLTMTTFCRIYASQQLLATSKDRGKKPANINQNNLNVFLHYTHPERVWSFSGFKKRRKHTSSTKLLHKI